MVGGLGVDFHLRDVELLPPEVLDEEPHLLGAELHLLEVLAVTGVVLRLLVELGETGGVVRAVEFHPGEVVELLRYPLNVNSCFALKLLY